MKTLLLAISLFTLSAQATVLESVTTCQMANRKAVLTLVFDQDENGTLEIMVDQLNTSTEEVLLKDYRSETIDAYGTTIEARIAEYTTVQNNVVSLVIVGDVTQGFVKGPLTKNEKINLIQCRNSVLWDY